MTLPEEQRVLREWKPLVDDLWILSKLRIPKITKVNEMMSFSVRSVHALIDFENLITVQNLNNCFGYLMPENKVVLDKRGVPILGWSLTTGRPIPENAPRKSTKKGAAKGGTPKEPSGHTSRKSRATRMLAQQALASLFPEITHEPQDEASSDGSDDTIMREIDEVRLALTEEANEESSSVAVAFLKDRRRESFPQAKVFGLLLLPSRTLSRRKSLSPPQKS